MATVLLQNTAEGGTNGTAVTTANSGGASGDAWSRLIIPGDVGTGNTLVFSTSSPYQGSLSYLMTQTAAAACSVYWTWTTAQTDFACRFGFKKAANPGSATTTIFRAFSDNAYGAAALAFDVQLTTAGKLVARDTADGISGSSSAGALTDGQWYTIEARYQATTNTTTINAYVVGSLTVAATATVTHTTATQVNSIRFGIGSASQGLTLGFDDLAVGFGGWLTRTDIANTPPVLAKTAQQRRTYAAGSAVTMPWTATDSGGTISSIAVVNTTKPTGATTPTVGGSATGTGTASAALTATATLASVGTYVFTATATDNNGSTDTDTYIFEVYPTVGTDTIIRSVTKNGYTVFGGALTNDAAGALTAVTDNDATTGLDSTTTPTAATGRVQLGPLGPTGIDLYVSANVIGGGTLTRVWRVYKEDGTTQIYSVTESGITGPTTDVKLSLDSTALAAVPLATANDISRAALWAAWTDTVV